MRRFERPEVKLANETAVRQKLAVQAYDIAPPIAAGMKRVMWFGDSDTPMPVDVPESIFSQVEAISKMAGNDPAPLDIGMRIQAKQNIYKLLQPYIDAQYPTLQPVRVKDAWWQRALRSFGLRT